MLDSRSCDSWSPALLRQESSLLARHEQRINHRHSSASQAVALASEGAGEGEGERLWADIVRGAAAKDAAGVAVHVSGCQEEARG